MDVSLLLWRLWLLKGEAHTLPATCKARATPTGECWVVHPVPTCAEPISPMIYLDLISSIYPLTRSHSSANIKDVQKTRTVSSVGRAPALQAGCHRFESCTVHFSICIFTFLGALEVLYSD
jgi:hypothetical protein